MINYRLFMHRDYINSLGNGIDSIAMQPSTTSPHLFLYLTIHFPWQHIPWQQRPWQHKRSVAPIPSLPYLIHCLHSQLLWESRHHTMQRIILDTWSNAIGTRHRAPQVYCLSLSWKHTRRKTPLFPLWRLCSSTQQNELVSYCPRYHKTSW